MTRLVDFLFAFWEALPWVAIGLMAALALRRQRESKVLMMQAVGSSAAFVVSMMRWVMDFLLAAFGVTSGGALGAVHAVFGFLLFLSLATFAAGYCLERFRRRGGGGEAVQVSARAVDG